MVTFFMRRSCMIDRIRLSEMVRVQKACIGDARNRAVAAIMAGAERIVIAKALPCGVVGHRLGLMRRHRRQVVHRRLRRLGLQPGLRRLGSLRGGGGGAVAESLVELHPSSSNSSSPKLVDRRTLPGACMRARGGVRRGAGGGAMKPSSSQAEFGLVERGMLVFVRIAQRGREGRADRRVHVEFEILGELVQLAVVKLVPRSAHVPCLYFTAVLMAPLASSLRSADVFSPLRYLVNTIVRRPVSAGSIGWAPTRSDGLAIIAARFTATAQPSDGSAELEYGVREIPVRHVRAVRHHGVVGAIADDQRRRACARAVIRAFGDLRLDRRPRPASRRGHQPLRASPRCRPAHCSGAR